VYEEGTRDAWLCARVRVRVWMLNCALSLRSYALRDPSLPLLALGRLASHMT
jgi:hypothetical protein